MVLLAIGHAIAEFASRRFSQSYALCMPPCSFCSHINRSYDANHCNGR